MERPGYFEKIRLGAAKRWDQLEADPELAGPWHQLFKQVQSPRHVLSELLQNADDAGATEATVEIVEGCFRFVHNGEDFSEEHFASLCRFGYSNKRALHTIGFRGIGFKSTFSLGPRVELRTPTLSVAFGRTRFTEPEWIEGSKCDGGLTRIAVVIADEERQRELEKNLAEWLKSPVSLLFFKHIRRIRIGDQEIHWGSLGPGPVPNTEWMALHEDPDSAFLVARSEAEPFPAEALAEIRQERLLSEGQDGDFPPSRVEIVLGAEGRLYVVLPTGVETELPFACNAPFIQDPARLKIKDPETSPTNRWLLARVGALVASTMLAWIREESASQSERARAYGLFPDVDRDDSSLEGVCGALVERAFDDALGSEPFLLTDAGEVTAANGAVVIPEDLFEVWRGDQVAALLDDSGRPAFSREVAANDRNKLIHWGLLDVVKKEDVLRVLQSRHLPRPGTWLRLLKLWAYVAPELTGYRHHGQYRDVRIVPVQGKDVLYAATEVVRLGEKRLLQSDKDWEFLSENLLALNHNWPRFLGENRRAAEDDAGREQVEGALAVLRSIGLEEASDVSKVIEKVAKEFFGKESVSLADCIRLAQIAAKLGASAGESFRFATRDRRLHGARNVVLFDRDGTLEGLLPEIWCSAHLLHPSYIAGFESCTSEDWQRWIASGRAGLLGFVPLTQTQSRVWGRAQVEAEVRRRGYTGAVTFAYVTSDFVVDDWDFDESHWRHWLGMAATDDKIWGRLVELVLAEPENYWSRSKGARALQVATTGSTRTILDAPLVPTWILKLRGLPCLPDTRGFYHKPSDLLRRTPETESFMDVEPFIHARLDHESARPLLGLLGVRSAPTGPGRLLDCLRALSKSEAPPTHEVDKWYRRLDQMLETCSTVDLGIIKKAFGEERILLTENMGWASAPGTFLSSDEEDVPGAAIVRASVRDLRLWRTLGVAERPTAELAIQWLRNLPSGQPVSQEDLRRVQALLARYPRRVWEECGHWLNLAGEWVAIEGLSYALTMQSLTPWSHLHKWVKQKTADLQRLQGEITAQAPFSMLPALSSHIEERFHQNPLFAARAEQKAWLHALGTELSRIELDDHAETSRIRDLAGNLARTSWQLTPGLEIVPYISGTPAGTPRRSDVVWLDTVLYVDDVPKAKLAKRVPEEIAKLFNRNDIKAALDYGFERSPEDIRAYLEENFKLSTRGKGGELEGDSTKSPDGETHGEVEPGGDSTESIDLEDATQMTSGNEGATGHEAGQGAEGITAEAVDQAEEGADLGTAAARSRAQKQHKPNIIERFARANGFQREGDNRFFHPDGSWIAKSVDGRFWDRHASSGELIRCYWAKDHCLEREPLQLESDVWALIDQRADFYGLILSGLDGEPVEFTGTQLRELRETERLTIYPATYRLVLDS